MQLEISNGRTPKGFYLLPQFVTPGEELELLCLFKDLPWQNVSMHGIVAKRQVVHYGHEYEYNSRTLTPAHPLPHEMQYLLKRAARYLKVLSKDIAEVLITHYPSGAGIGWHRDAPMFEKLLGVSLGGDCYLKMRSGGPDTTQVFKTILIPGSAYIISEEARWKWHHHIPPVKSDRYSITFRTLKHC